MDAIIHWYIKKRVLYIALVGDVDIEALPEVYERILKHLEAGTPPVHLIRDERRMGKTPTRLPAISNVRQLAQHPTLGWVVSINGNLNAAAQFLVNLAIRLARLRVCRVRSMQEAIEFLKSMDTTLDFSQVDESVSSS